MPYKSISDRNAYASTYYRVYYKKHRDSLLAYKARYRAANKEKLRAAATEYDRRHQEERRQYRKRNRKRQELRDALCRAKTPEKYRALRSRSLGWVKRRARKRGCTVGAAQAIRAVYMRARNESRVRCYLCMKGIPIGRRHVDHVVPLSRGGAHSVENLAIACAACNMRKRTKTPVELGMLF